MICSCVLIVFSCGVHLVSIKLLTDIPHCFKRFGASANFMISGLLDMETQNPMQRNEKNKQQKQKVISKITKHPPSRS